LKQYEGGGAKECSDEKRRWKRERPNRSSNPYLCSMFDGVINGRCGREYISKLKLKKANDLNESVNCNCLGLAAFAPPRMSRADNGFEIRSWIM
jgi:hypothetical protein